MLGMLAAAVIHTVKTGHSAGGHPAANATAVHGCLSLAYARDDMRSAIARVPTHMKRECSCEGTVYVRSSCRNINMSVCCGGALVPPCAATAAMMAALAPLWVVARRTVPGMKSTMI